MPSFYGQASQVGNVHNLSHIVDDVEHLKMPLSNCDAFPFESYLGKLRRMVNSSKKPLVQVANKINECNDNYKDFKSIDIIYEEKTNLKTIELNGFMLKSVPPNNVFRTRNGKYFEIVQLIAVENIDESELLSMTVRKLKIIGELYEYPYSSKDVGFFEVERLQEEKVKKIKIAKITSKCLLFNVRNKLYLSELLHS